MPASFLFNLWGKPFIDNHLTFFLTIITFNIKGINYANHIGISFAFKKYTKLVGKTVCLYIVTISIREGEIYFKEVIKKISF